MSKVIDTRQERMRNAAYALRSRLNELHGDTGHKFVAIVYFDEAHTLQNERRDNSSRRSPYFALMHVLTALVDTPIFFVFLTTNPSLSALPPTDADYPSIRVQDGWKLIPPFFELPFDTFCYDFTATVGKNRKLTLNGVCELEQIVRFGRPM